MTLFISMISHEQPHNQNFDNFFLQKLQNYDLKPLKTKLLAQN